MSDATKRQTSEAMRADEDVATVTPVSAHDGMLPVDEGEGEGLPAAVLSTFAPLPSALGVTYSFI